MIAAVILAAGASTRMGRPKAWLPMPDGTCFLERLVETFATAGIDRIVAVVAPSTSAVGTTLAARHPELAIIENPDPSRGQLSSLQVGLAWLAARRPEAVLVTPVDLPLIPVHAVVAVVATWRRTRAPIVRPACGTRHGHPVLFDASLSTELRAAEPSGGARAVLHAHASGILDVPVDDPGVYDDVDTPDDYRRLFGASVEASISRVGLPDRS